MSKFTGKIYLKDSSKARLADVRARIVREVSPLEPCDYEDLVFEKAEDKSCIPENALMKWKFDCNGEHEPMWFFTTAERCKKMVSEDPSYWTEEKLKHFADAEKKLYQYWYDGEVYGFIIEKWDEAGRSWKKLHSLFGMYGAEDLLENLNESGNVRDGCIVCIDEEEMKYEFDNTEKTTDQFS